MTVLPAAAGTGVVYVAALDSSLESGHSNEELARDDRDAANERVLVGDRSTTTSPQRERQLTPPDG
jgi:hypothetical protein